MPESKMTQLSDQTAAFKALSEKEVVEMFHQATFRNLSAGDILTKQSDADPIAFVILEGMIRMVQDPKEHPRTVATFSKGDWIEGTALTADSLQMTSAIAAEPTRVMILDKTTIDSLNEKTQLSVYKHLAQVFTERIGQLGKNENNLVMKNIRLKEDIFGYRSQSKTDFHHSEMIKGIIKNVPRLPPFVTTLSSQMFTKEIVDQIKRDPSLVAVVLKTINSAYYSFQNRISDIHHAAVLLGFEQIYQIVIAEGIRRTMPNTPDFHALHLHSEIVSHIAFMLSLESRNGHPGEMASLGLLHEIGQIVLQLLKDQHPKLTALIDTLDQAQLGSLLLKEWNLPDVLWKNVEFQSYPEFASPHHVPEDLRHAVTMLYLSHLCYDLFQGKKEEELPITFFDEYMALTNWKGLTLDEIARNRLLPALVRKSKAYPLPMRQLIEKQIKT